MPGPSQLIFILCVLFFPCLVNLEELRRSFFNFIFCGNIDLYHLSGAHQKLLIQPTGVDTEVILQSAIDFQEHK